MTYTYHGHKRQCADQQMRADLMIPNAGTCRNEAKLARLGQRNCSESRTGDGSSYGAYSWPRQAAGVNDQNVALGIWLHLTETAAHWSSSIKPPESSDKTLGAALQPAAC